MKKDYLPATNVMPEEDGEFVERHWTRCWDESATFPDPREVPLTEQFRLMRRELELLPRGARLLDGGCGLGSWTRYLAGAGFAVRGVDISARTVDRLRRGHPGLDFVRGDLRQLDDPDGTFDGYLSWGAFEHFEVGLGPCLTEARRVLTPGGYLWLTVPHDNWRHTLRGLARLERWDSQFRTGRGYEQPMRFYQWRFTPAELVRELELHGFETLRVRAIHKDHGLKRALLTDLGLREGSAAFRVAHALLRQVLPAWAVSHMLFGAARRRP